KELTRRLPLEGTRSCRTLGLNLLHSRRPILLRPRHRHFPSRRRKRSYEVTALGNQCTLLTDCQMQAHLQKRTCTWRLGGIRGEPCGRPELSHGVTVSFLLVQAYLVFPASLVMSKFSGEATL